MTRFVFYYFLTLGILALVFLGVPLSCSKPHAPAPPAQPLTVIDQQHSATHRIGVDEQFEGDPHKDFGEAGHCSGTAVARNALLTAQHCFKDSNLIRIDDDPTPTVILAALIDGNDHVIYIVRHEFTHWANIDQRPLVDGEHVHMWGAPGKNTNVYRVGYYVWLASEPEIDKHFMLQQFVLPTYRGDSGAGIFDEHGSVVAVITFADESANELSEPLQFTDEQLDVLGEVQ